MHRVAIFVDAGYLFAQGSVAIAGSRAPRSNLALNAAVAISQLRKISDSKAPACGLLRIYWYDGAHGGVQLTADQAILAFCDDVKVRLGAINSQGEQKGVDSLIVTDLIELARQKSICDAVLISGDEDVRVGVQIAQNYGVRVHLVGIAPSRGNQSPQLMQESDTTTELSKETIESFLSLRVQPPARNGTDQKAAAVVGVAEVALSVERVDEINEKLESAAGNFCGSLLQTDIVNIQAYWKTERGIPSDLDRKLLPIGRDAIGRNLEAHEKRLIRSALQRHIKARIGEN